MFQRLGINNRLDLILFLSLALLVAVAPLGNEATHPLVLGIYRTLLLVLTIGTAWRAQQYRLPQISILFLSAAGVVLFAMYASVMLRLPGSHFEGIYNFYQNALFLAAFIGLARFNLTRTSSWKNAILVVVVAIDLIYVLAARLQGVRPFQGPFVNPNYFASYLVVGFSICAAAALFSRSRRTQLTAGAAGLVLLYGIGQTSSRGAFLSVLALLAIALFRAAQQYRIAWWRIAVVAILIAVIAIAANPATIRKFLDRGQHDVYSYERTQIWMKTVSMISTHPLVGVGMGRFYYVSKLFTPAVDGAIGRYRRWPNIAHSEYLQYTAELGIPAALLMFAIGAYLFQTTWRRAQTVPPEARIAQEAAILTAVGLGVHALVDNNWTVPVAAAGLAVISLADLLPYQRYSYTLVWTPVRMAALGIFVALVFIQSVTIPVLGLYFNEVGHQAFMAGNFDRAEQMHRLGLGFVPDHPVMLDNLGMVYFDGYVKTQKKEYLDRAESLFRDSMAANPSFDIPAGHLETVLFQRLTGNLSKDQSIHVLIVSADQLGLRANPYNPFIRKNLAEALYNLGHKQEALEELQKSVEYEPNFVQGYLRLAQWEEESGHLREAAMYRNKASDIVIQFKNHTTTDPFEALLLDRPAPRTGKP